MLADPLRRFHPLEVRAVTRTAIDGVIVEFSVPDHLGSAFTGEPGQHVTLRTTIHDQEVRRSYSVCSRPGESLRVAIRKLPGGRMSTFIHDLEVGQIVDVMPPLGAFTLPPPNDRDRQYTFIAAGSGITPILAMIADCLGGRPTVRTALLYINRTTRDTMLVDELHELKCSHPSRLQLTFATTRESRAASVLGRRPDRADVQLLLDAGVLPPADHWFLCGPEALAELFEAVLAGRGIPPTSIHRESYGAAPATRAARTFTDAPADNSMTFSFRGRDSTVFISREQALLDAAVAACPDLPYSCRTGACSTCRARVRAGSVAMGEAPGLTALERGQGYVLACQATTLSPHVEIDFDV